MKKQLCQIFKIAQTASSIRNIQYEEVQIFPVPASNEIQLNFTQITEGSIEIEVYNANGMSVLRSTVSVNDRISVANLPVGTYVLKALQKDRQYMGKFSVVR